jgi:hypothetical protein
MQIKSLILSIFFFILTATSVLAQEDATQGAEATDSTTQKLKERIEKIVEEKKQQIQGVITDLSYTKRGFIGEIQRLTQETITIKNEKGTQIIPLNQDLKLIKAGKEILPDGIAVGDWTMVLGIVESDEFVPKKIYVYSESLLPISRFVEIGTIQEITTKNLVIKPRSKEETIELLINTKTRYQDSAGEKAMLKNFEENMQVLLIGIEDENSKTTTVLRALAPFEKE